MKIVIKKAWFRFTGSLVLLPLSPLPFWVFLTWLDEKNNFMKHRPTLLDFGLLIFISFVWGSSFLAIKIGLRAFDPFSLAATRVFIAGFFMYLVARLRGEIFPTDKTILKQLALIGLFGSSAFMLISWGQQYISTSTAGIMLAFGPLNLLFLAHFMTEDEKLSIPKLIGFGFGFAGVALLFSGAGLANIETEGFGMVAMFVASIAYALSMIFVRKIRGVSSINIATGFLVMAALVTVPISLVFDPPWAHEITLEAALAVLFLGIMSSGISSILLIFLVKRAGVTFSSYSNYLTPLVAVLLGVTFLGEIMNQNTWWAMVLILGGVAIANLMKLRV